MPTEVKNFNSPDETRPFDGKGKADVCNLAGKVVGRGVFELTGYGEEDVMGQEVIEAFGLSGFEEGKNPSALARRSSATTRPRSVTSTTSPAATFRR